MSFEVWAVQFLDGPFLYIAAIEQLFSFEAHMSKKFTLAIAPTFKADVSIPVPGGRPANVSFTFKHKTRDELKDLLAGLEGREDVDVVLEITTGWGIDEAFEEDNVAILLQNYPGAALAIIDTFLKEVSGARRGN